MQVDYGVIICTVINFILLFLIMVIIYKSIRGFKNFIDRNKEMDKKIDSILNKLENKKDN
ncbi:hypothetical protein [Clostridium sp.]|jgi:large-conductance mechanosensitive channel|uniref:hypothetical protein n=1 Tax=Clostridium sp. TaxID=1506 RepID=UPI002FDE0BAF